MPNKRRKVEVGDRLLIKIRGVGDFMAEAVEMDFDGLPVARVIDNDTWSQYKLNFGEDYTLLENLGPSPLRQVEPITPPN
jgi:hypothetical protein